MHNCGLNAVASSAINHHAPFAVVSIPAIRISSHNLRAGKA